MNRDYPLWICLSGAQQGRQGWAKSPSDLPIALKWMSRAVAQYWPSSSSYSASKTALPAAHEGLVVVRTRRTGSTARRPRSRSSPTSSRAWSRSFFSATAMPRRWTCAATQRLKRSWSARAEREAGLVFVAGDVVGLDRVEALARAASRTAVAQDRRRSRGTGGCRASARRASLRSAGRAPRGEAARVRPPALPGADVEVADDLAAAAVQLGAPSPPAFRSRRRRRRGTSRRGVDLALQLPLPRLRRRPRLPVGRRRLRGQAEREHRRPDQQKQVLATRASAEAAHALKLPLAAQGKRMRCISVCRAVPRVPGGRGQHSYARSPRGTGSPAGIAVNGKRLHHQREAKRALHEAPRKGGERCGGPPRAGRAGGADRHGRNRRRRPEDGRHRGLHERRRPCLPMAIRAADRSRRSPTARA